MEFHIINIANIILQAIKIIRSMGVTAKIVGIGSTSTKEEKQSLLDAGSDHYVAKPITPANFASWLQEIDEKIQHR